MRRGAFLENSCRSRSSACVTGGCKRLDTYFDEVEPLPNRSRRLTRSTYSKFRVLAPNSLIFRKTARRAACKDILCRSRSTACVAAVCNPLDIYFEGAEPLLNRSRRLTGSTYSKFRVLAPNSLIFKRKQGGNTRASFVGVARDRRRALPTFASAYV